MDIKRHSTAGSLESNDCFITLRNNHDRGIQILLKSTVYKQFGNHIKDLVGNELEGYALKHISVVVNDRGALDYTLKARLATAVERACK